MGKLLLLPIIIVLISSFVLAQPFNEQINVNPNVGVDIQVLTERIAQPNQAIDINVHAFNTSSGLLLKNDTTSCELNIYNFSGSEKVGAFLDFNSAKEIFNYTINSDILANKQSYPFLIHCNTSNVGGFSAGTFIVTQSGVLNETKNAPVIAILALILVIIIYFWIGNNLTMESMAEHGLIKVSLYTGIIWLLLVPIRFSVENLLFTQASSSMIGLMDAFYTAMIWINVAFTFYMIIFLIIGFIRTATGGGQSNEE